MAPPSPPPPPKLRQSSIHSFLLPNRKNPPTPSPAADDYERLRRETIRRNREFLRKLGIAAAADDSNPNPLPSKRPKNPPPPSVPLRRSSRLRPTSSPSDADDESPSSVDSSVHRYNCRADDAPLLDTNPPFPSQNPNSPIAGFRIVGKAFRDPSLARIYSLDVLFSFDEDRFLIAAGGHGGFISVYGGGGGGVGNRIVEGDGDKSSEMETELPPLMSWKGSGSWISGVRFVEEKENPTLLLSSSNDGAIVVWDIKKPTSSRPPPVVAKSTAGLHSGGIFAMDRFGCSIATASKDSSVGFSRLTPAGDLVAERNISGHHSGVIRGVCFR